jgi:hypothetical protein
LEKSSKGVTAKVIFTRRARVLSGLLLILVLLLGSLLLLFLSRSAVKCIYDNGTNHSPTASDLKSNGEASPLIGSKTTRLSDSSIFAAKHHIFTLLSRPSDHESACVDPNFYTSLLAILIYISGGVVLISIVLTCIYVRWMGEDK